MYCILSKNNERICAQKKISSNRLITETLNVTQ